MTTDVAAAQAAKVEGQERAGRRLAPKHWQAFVAALDTVSMDEWFTANDLRVHLIDVPESARATLFAQAQRAGLIEKVYFTRRGKTYELGEKSDGLSARRKPISVYARMPVPAATPAGAS